MMLVMMRRAVMKTLWSVVSCLQSSELVADFQRLCGLHPGTGTSTSRGRVSRTATRTELSPPARNGQNPGSSSKCQYEVRNLPLYFLFVGSATLGNEVFYISFLPFIHWNLDPFLCRRLVNMWAVVMYMGQVIKDMLKQPRPASPPVVKLEQRDEYGMPSTHAMAATSIAFTLLLSAPERVQFQFETGLILAVVFTVLVSLSRLYTGMHSALDVICGTFMSALVLGISYRHWSTLDFLQLHSPLSPLIAMVIPFFLCYTYPELEHYSPTRKDTTIILGASAGCSVGYWLNQQIGITFEPAGPFPITLPELNMGIFLIGFGRFIVGVLTLVLTRQGTYWVALRLLCWYHQAEISDIKARRRKEIEVPLQFSTYFLIGIVNSVAVCRIFQLMRLL